MHMNIFAANSGGAFSMMSLTSLLLDQVHVPSRIGELGIFQAEGVRTTKVSIERQSDSLVLVQSTVRGGPAIQNIKDDRTLIDIPTARLALEDSITADEVQGIRALGSESDLMTLQDELNRRNRRMSQNLEATIEFHRVCALKGTVLDANGDTLLDLFTTFGVSAQTEVAFDLDAASPASGALRKVCSGVIRTIEDALGSLPYSDIYAMTSSQFFDSLTAHPEYRANKLSFEDARQLNDRIARRRVTFGGITFEEYRGTVGSTKYVADDKAHIFPIGVPDLFLTRYAPAEWWETVNTVGLPRYAKLFIDPQDPNSKVTSRVQTQMLNICTRPRVLIPAKKGS